MAITNDVDRDVNESAISARLRRSPSLALRPEAFGALAYNYDNRRLSFLRDEDLVELVQRIDEFEYLGAALDALGIPPQRRPAYERAASALLESGALAAVAPEALVLAEAEAPGPARQLSGLAEQAAITSTPKSSGFRYGTAEAGRMVGAAQRDAGLSGSEPHGPVAVQSRSATSIPQANPQPAAASRSLAERFKSGLQAPICLTWELTWSCNLACVHCLSSSGRRDPSELTTAECRSVIDQLVDLSVFYVNLGGGEPMIRRDFFEIIEYATKRGVGVKFSTNGTYIDATAARRLAAMDYLDIQVSVDGADAATNDAVRGEGSFDAAIAAMGHLADAGFGAFKISVVATRENLHQLDEFVALADRYGAQLRLTRFRPSGRGVTTWSRLRPTADQQRSLYHWLLSHPEVLTGDSFFHLNALGDAAIPGLNLCGAGRVVCLIDPIGDVYACPFVIHDEFKAGSVRGAGGFASVWQHSPLFEELRSPGSAGACASCGEFDACQGGCMASKFFAGLALDDPDPECVKGHGEALLGAVSAAQVPVTSVDHSRPGRAGSELAPGPNGHVVAVALRPR